LDVAVVGVNPGDELVPVPIDQGFLDERRFLEPVLDDLGIDVLSGGPDDDVLRPALDEEVPVLVERPAVARRQPAVGRERLPGLRLVCNSPS
jgi:hypothetical protein